MSSSQVFKSTLQAAEASLASAIAAHSHDPEQLLAILGDLKNHLTALGSLPSPVWNVVSDETMPERGIRVIAAEDSYVIGDCYYGSGGIVLKHTDDPGYMEEKRVVCWRYTRTEQPVPASMLPTYWQALPDVPVKPRGPFEFAHPLTPNAGSTPT